MADKLTIQSPKVWVDEASGVGLVEFNGDPDCLVDMEDVRDAGEAV